MRYGSRLAELFEAGGAAVDVGVLWAWGSEMSADFDGRSSELTVGVRRLVRVIFLDLAAVASAVADAGLVSGLGAIAASRDIAKDAAAVRSAIEFGFRSGPVPGHFVAPRVFAGTAVARL